MIINIKKNKLLIFGNGYSTKYLIKKAKNYFNSISVATRSIPSLKLKNINYINFYDVKEVSKILENSIIISTVPPNHKNEDPVLKVYKNYFKRYNSAFGYISSTSVYGRGTIFEDTKVNPNSKRGMIRVNVEKEWKKYCKSIKIFRSGGIYGINRHPMLSYLKGNIEIAVKPEHYTNRVHVQDLANIILYALSKSVSSEVINVVDPNPSIGFEAIRFVANSLQLRDPIPVHYRKANLSEMRKSFFETSKIVRSSVINKKFKYDFLYPYYAESLLLITRKFLKNNKKKHFK